MPDSPSDTPDTEPLDSSTPDRGAPGTSTAEIPERVREDRPANATEKPIAEDGGKLEQSEARAEARDGHEKALQEEYQEATKSRPEDLERDQPNPDEDVDPETSEPVEYPERNDNVETDPVGSGHYTIQIAQLHGQSEATAEWLAEINASLANAGHAGDTTAQVEQRADPPADPMQGLLGAAVVVGLTRSILDGRSDQRSTTDDSDLDTADQGTVADSGDDEPRRS